MELQLVADTNLFFECKKLEQLPWAKLQVHDIIIVLTKPVLDEIDKHKKASGRTRERALEVFGRVRAMLVESRREVEIQSGSPRVVLRFVPNVRPDPDLGAQLDYTKNDERLVGIVSAMRREATFPNVKLFTEDTGPAATADGLGLPYLLIDQSWRRPAAETTEQKRVRELDKDLSTYRAQEPVISIEAPAGNAGEGVLEVVRRVAIPLGDQDVERAVHVLTLKHPIRTDFKPPQASTTLDSAGDTITTEWAPPADEEIARYRGETYPGWLDACRGVLKTLHEGRDEAEPALELRWAMSNTGTRPATQVRVEFRATGPVAVLRRSEPDVVDNGSEDEPQKAEVVPAAVRPRFPSPPRPPPFQKSVKRTPRASAPALSNATGLRPPSDLASLALGGREGLADLVGRSLMPCAGLRDILEQQRRLTRFTEEGLFGARAYAQPLADFNIGLPRMPKPHDLEAFYYDWPLEEPVAKGALTCDLWRHHGGEEIFEFVAIFTTDGEVRGTIEAAVHADNLTHPVKQKVVVGRRIEALDLNGLVEEMVAACEGRS